MRTPTNSHLSTILVVEDDPKTASSIQLYLHHDGYQVLLAHSGLAAIEMARTHSPDLVVLDLMLPQLDGFDVCRLLRAESTIPIIMLTARTLEEDQLEGFALGADDYVTKPFSPRMLLARVRATLWRTQVTSTPKAKVLEQHGFLLDCTRHELSFEGEPIPLTMKEFKLLETLMAAPGQVFSRDQLIQQAFGLDYEGLDRSVDTMLMRLRRKIEPDPQHPTYIVLTNSEEISAALLGRALAQILRGETPANPADLGQTKI